MDHASWFYRKGRPDCTTCIEIKEANNQIPDCKACGKVDIIEKNLLVHGIIERYRLLFFNGMGSINPQGIRIALDAECIPQHMRAALIQKIILYIHTALMQKDE